MTQPTVQFDHMAVDVRDLDASARLIADLLGLAAPVPEGADDDMLRIDLDHGAFILFTASPEPHPCHVAFRVAKPRFDAVAERLRQKGIAFGNDPLDPTNERLDDFRGGGRVYFHDADGHLWEVAC
ncbi:MAG: VOC family protein [Polyangiaceae bacterium]